MAVTHTYDTDNRNTARNTAVRRFNAIDWIAMTLLIVGGLNWGLVGLADFNLVAAIFGGWTSSSRSDSIERARSQKRVPVEFLKPNPRNPRQNAVPQHPCCA